MASAQPTLFRHPELPKVPTHLKMRAQDRITQAKIACNLATYALLSSTRLLPHDKRLQNSRHWYRFPFSLRDKVLWSPALKAWFRPADESATECMLKMPAYEPTGWVEPKPGEVFVDVGAYIGWYSIAASQGVGPAGQVIALEPDAANRRQLQDNLALNCISNVSLVPSAAWSKSGRVGWQASDVPVWHAASGNGDGAASVEAVAIDDLVRQMQLPRVDWIKMDIEGGEVAALEGASSTLQRFHPTLFIELHETFAAVSKFLRPYGYSTTRVEFDLEPEKHGWLLACHQ